MLVVDVIGSDTLDADGVLRFFDTSTGGFKYINEVQCQDVGWAVVVNQLTPHARLTCSAGYSLQS